MPLLPLWELSSIVIRSQVLTSRLWQTKVTPAAMLRLLLLGGSREPEVASRPLLKLIEQEIDPHAQYCVGNSGDDSVAPAKSLGHTEQPARYAEVHNAVQQIKSQGQQRARGRILCVNFCAQRRRSKAHHGFCDAVDTNRTRGQAILCQADGGACQQSRNRIAPRHGEEDRDQQRQIKIRKERETPRQKRLQEECNQRNADSYRQAEPVDFNLLPRCVSDGHASEECLDRTEAARQTAPEILAVVEDLALRFVAWPFAAQPQPS